MKHLFKFFLLGAVISSVFYMSSCGGFSSKSYYGVLMTDQESINDGLTFVSQAIEESDYVTKITFYPRKDKGVTLFSDRMTVYLYSEGNDSIQEWTVGLSTKDGQYSQSEQIKDKLYKGIKKENPRENAVQYPKIDFSHIAEYVNEAGKQVKELGENSDEPIFFSGVGKYTISFNSDPSKIKHSFTIESRDTTKSTKYRDVFYEFPFEVGADGKVVLKK